MFNYLKKTASTAVLASIGLYSANALSETYVVNDFKFGMNDPSFASVNTPGGAQPNGAGPYGTIIEGVYQGSNSTNELVDFFFFITDVYVYTAATNQGSSNTPAGSIAAGGPPITIDRTALTADMSSWYAEWNGTEFLQGNNNAFAACSANSLAGLLSPNAVVTDNGSNNYTVDWNSCITGAPFDSQIGFWRLELKCTTCITEIPYGSESISAVQASYTTQTVGQSDGSVVLTSSYAAIYGVNPANTTYVWTPSNGSIVDTDADEGTFTFDPSSVPVGTYTITDKFIDTTQFSVDQTHLVGTSTIQIRVVADTVANYIDSDGDGIVDSFDSGSLTPQQLQSEYSNALTHVLTTDIGTLKVGSTAFCVSSGARITLDNIIASAGANCSTVANGIDKVIEGRGGIGGYFDFEINGLSTSGAVANIVIPLTAAIPTYAVYRKYSITGGWTNFDVTSDAAIAAGDTLASAASISDGVCPAVGDAAYTAGLTAGDSCLQVTIKDGGPNDADGSANQSIKDPGGIAQIQSDVEAELPSGCSISGNPQNLNEHSEWMLLAAFIAWLGFASYRNKKRAE